MRINQNSVTVTFSKGASVLNKIKVLRSCSSKKLCLHHILRDTKDYFAEGPSQLQSFDTESILLGGRNGEIGVSTATVPMVPGISL